MTKEEFIAQLERASSSTEGLPVSASLLRHLSQALKKGDPAWWLAVQKAWEKRAFFHWTEAWSLLLTAVHDEALGDPKSPLRAYFPTCGGSAEVDPAPAFAKWLESPSKGWLENLKRRHRRTFVPARAPLWLRPAAAYFQRRGFPYYVVEINAGSGLNLAADHLYPQRGFDSSLVAARIGLEPVPINLESPEDRRWLSASLFPEETSELKGLAAVVDSVIETQRREANFIQLVACPTEKGPGFIAKNIPADEEDVGILVMNMATTARMSDAQYKDYHGRMVQALKPWGARGLWLEVENVRGERFSDTYQVLLHKPSGAGFEDFIMLRFDADKRTVDDRTAAAEKWLKSGK